MDRGAAGTRQLLQFWGYTNHWPGGALKEPLLRGFALSHSIKFGADVGHATRNRHAPCARRAHCGVMLSHHL